MWPTDTNASCGCVLARYAIQALLGHKDVSTMMIYTHVLQQGGYGVASPLDDLPSVGEG